jgi:hypothetical protein
MAPFLKNFRRSEMANDTASRWLAWLNLSRERAFVGCRGKGALGRAVQHSLREKFGAARHVPRGAAQIAAIIVMEFAA